MLDFRGSRSLEKFWHEVSAVSSSLVLIKDTSSLHKSSSFMLRNNNSKSKKISEYSINPDLTKKLRHYTKPFFVISKFLRAKIKDYPIRVMTITKNTI